jgi:hypothetical protein
MRAGRPWLDALLLSGNLAPARLLDQVPRASALTLARRRDHVSFEALGAHEPLRHDDAKCVRRLFRELRDLDRTLRTHGQPAALPSGDRDWVTGHEPRDVYLAPHPLSQLLELAPGHSAGIGEALGRDLGRYGSLSPAGWQVPHPRPLREPRRHAAPEPFLLVASFEDEHEEAWRLLHELGGEPGAV